MSLFIPFFHFSFLICSYFLCTSDKVVFVVHETNISPICFPSHLIVFCAKEALIFVILFLSKLYVYIVLKVVFKAYNEKQLSHALHCHSHSQFLLPRSNCFKIL